MCCRCSRCQSGRLVVVKGGEGEVEGVVDVEVAD